MISMNTGLYTFGNIDTWQLKLSGPSQDASDP